MADLEGISRPNTEEAEHSVGTCIEKSDQGSEDEDEAAEREGEEHRGSLRGGDRDVLRCHLAYHHVQEHDNEKGDDQRDAVNHVLRERRNPSPSSKIVATAGSATAPSTNEAMVMPSWAAARLRVRFLFRPTAIWADLRDLVQDIASCRDVGELGGDEEPVGEEEQDQPEEGGPVHDSVPVPIAVPDHPDLIARCPSIDSTSNAVSPTRITSPTWGKRPSSATRKPPRVS